eukprot:SAG31_NODE_1601_length_7786_cov_33.553272_2_plen_81_part_00
MARHGEIRYLGRIPIPKKRKDEEERERAEGSRRVTLLMALAAIKHEDREVSEDSIDGGVSGYGRTIPVLRSRVLRTYCRY